MTFPLRSVWTFGSDKVKELQEQRLYESDESSKLDERREPIIMSML